MTKPFLGPTGHQGQWILRVDPERVYYVRCGEGACPDPITGAEIMEAVRRHPTDENGGRRARQEERALLSRVPQGEGEEDGYTDATKWWRTYHDVPCANCEHDGGKHDPENGNCETHRTDGGIGVCPCSHYGIPVNLTRRSAPPSPADGLEALVHAEPTPEHDLEGLAEAHCMWVNQYSERPAHWRADETVLERCLCPGGPECHFLEARWWIEALRSCTVGERENPSRS